MGRSMKKRFSSKDDVGVAYEISGASRVDSDGVLFARNNDVKEARARMEALHP